MCAEKRRIYRGTRARQRERKYSKRQVTSGCFCSARGVSLILTPSHSFPSVNSYHNQLIVVTQTLAVILTIYFLNCSTEYFTYTFLFKKKTPVLVISSAILQQLNAKQQIAENQTEPMKPATSYNSS